MKLRIYYLPAYYGDHISIVIKKLIDAGSTLGTPIKIEVLSHDANIPAELTIIVNGYDSSTGMVEHINDLFGKHDIHKAFIDAGLEGEIINILKIE